MMHGGPRMRGGGGPRGPQPHFQQHQGTGLLHQGPPPQHGHYAPRYSGPGSVASSGPEPPAQGDPDYSAKMFEFRQDLDAKRLRKSIYRKTVDYFTPVVKYLEQRSVFVDPVNFPAVLGDPLYYTEMLPCVAYPHNMSNAITTKFIRQATNKVKCPVFVTLWTPEGRRLVTGSSSGEFTLWNGLTFNFETILQAHDSAVRSMVWSKSDTWLVTGDATGHIKYWQANMNNVKSFQAHRDSIRGISFCPTDFKFATGSDDGTIRIWDFETCETLKVLRGGHGGEVKCVDWHPKKSLLVTGSRDNQQPVKLWDPRTADAVGTLYLHKGPVTDLKWNPIESNYLLSSSRDSLVKLFDLRTMKDFQTCRGHKKDVMSVAWHPIYQMHFCSGGMDGSLLFWNVGTEREVGFVENAHDGSIWSMSWHPQGHILCTGSNDCSVKFWTRNRPGDTMKDKYNAKARSETNSVVERSEIEYEDDEDEVVVGEVNLDNQDTTEFDSNVPRPLRSDDSNQHDQPEALFHQPFGPPAAAGGYRPNFDNQPRFGGRGPHFPDNRFQQYPSQQNHGNRYWEPRQSRPPAWSNQTRPETGWRPPAYPSGTQEPTNQFPPLAAPNDQEWPPVGTSGSESQSVVSSAGSTDDVSHQGAEKPRSALLPAPPEMPPYQQQQQYNQDHRGSKRPWEQQQHYDNQNQNQYSSYDRPRYQQPYRDKQQHGQRGDYNDQRPSYRGGSSRGRDRGGDRGGWRGRNS